MSYWYTDSFTILFDSILCLYMYMYIYMYISQSILLSLFYIHPVWITVQIPTWFHHVALVALESIQGAVHATWRDPAYRQNFPQAFRKVSEGPWCGAPWPRKQQSGILNLETRISDTYMTHFINSIIVLEERAAMKIENGLELLHLFGRPEGTWSFPGELLEGFQKFNLK